MYVRAKKIIIAYMLCLFSSVTHVSCHDLFFKPIKTSGWSLREDFLQDLARMFHADIFIETGTSYGATTNIAKNIFKTVHTIELNEILYTRAREIFFEDLNVFVYEGDSAVVLPKVLSKIRSRKSMFWLDGHFSGGTTAKGSSNTPILQELKAIKDAGITQAVILVDDVCCFQSKGQEPYELAQGYPTIGQLKDALLDINADYVVIVYGDIVIAYPASYKINLSPCVQAMTISRMFDGHTMPYEHVFKAEGLIASKSTDAELEALWDMCTYHFNQTRVYPYLWYSLALFNARRYAEAADNLSIVLASGYTDWRISWYGAQASDRCGKNNEHFYRELLNCGVTDFKAAGQFLAML